MVPIDPQNVNSKAPYHHRGQHQSSSRASLGSLESMGRDLICWALPRNTTLRLLSTDINLPLQIDPRVRRLWP